jgi:CRISPR-associated protein Csm2
MPPNRHGQRQSGHGAKPPQVPPGGAAPSTSPVIAKIAFGETIDSKLYSDIAEQAAKWVAGDRRSERNVKDNKPSQLRRFYDELVMLQDKVRSDRQAFDRQEPFIQMLKAKVAYAEGREKVDGHFGELLRRVVDQAMNAEALRQARLFMEAFMAFYKIHGPKD